MTKKITLLTFAFFIVVGSYGQTTKETKNIIPKTKTRYFEFGIGISSIYFRDKTSSSLAYKGNGPFALHLAGTKQTSNKKFREWNINTRIQSATPDISNVTEWNKPASFIGLDFMLRKLKGLNKKNNAKWQFFGGTSLGSNLQLATIPSANNSFAYNFSWIQLGLEGMVKRDLTLKNKKLQFTNKTSLPVLGINVRPLSYVGLLPQENIWSQNEEISAAFLKNPKLFSLHDNLAIKNDVSVDFVLRKSKFGIIYSWQYQNNSVSVNSLQSTNSSISINYSIKLKNK